MVYISGIVQKASDWFDRLAKGHPTIIDLSGSWGALENHRGAVADAIVMDGSGTMGASDYPPSRHDAAKAAACQYIEQLAEAQPDTVVTIISFGSGATLISPPRRVGEEAEELKRAIRAAKLGSTTNLGAGLAMAGRQIERVPQARRPRVIILTDGHSNCGPDPEKIAEGLKGSGVQVDAIGIGGSPSDVNEAQLRRIVSVVDGETRYWFIRDAGDLARKFEALALREV